MPIFENHHIWFQGSYLFQCLYPSKRIERIEEVVRLYEERIFGLFWFFLSFAGIEETWILLGKRYHRDIVSCIDESIGETIGMMGYSSSPWVDGSEEEDVHRLKAKSKR
jgi:hypothetical protein